MASVSKSASRLIFPAIFVAFCLIGWAARATLAQDPTQEPAPVPVLDARAEAPLTSQEVPVAQSTAAAPGIPFPEPQLLDSPRSKAEVLAPVRELTPAANQPVGNAGDDPEKSALAFVEQNQKMAESQLKSLKAEQAKLQDRLRKVEAGIKRWESLVGALKQSQGSVAVASPVTQGNWKQAEPPEPEPQRLAPAGSVVKPPTLRGELEPK